MCVHSFYFSNILWAIKALNKDISVVPEVISLWKSKGCCIGYIRKVLQESYSLLSLSVLCSLLRRYLFPLGVSVVVWSGGSAAGSFECRCLSGICRAKRRARAHTHAHTHVYTAVFVVTTTWLVYWFTSHHCFRSFIHSLFLFLATNHFFLTFEVYFNNPKNLFSKLPTFYGVEMFHEC